MTQGFNNIRNILGEIKNISGNTPEFNITPETLRDAFDKLKQTGSISGEFGPKKIPNRPTINMYPSEQIKALPYNKNAYRLPNGMLTTDEELMYWADRAKSIQAQAKQAAKKAGQSLGKAPKIGAINPYLAPLYLGPEWVKMIQTGKPFYLREPSEEDKAKMEAGRQSTIDTINKIKQLFGGVEYNNTNASVNNNSTGVPTKGLNGQPDFEYIDDNTLTGGKSIPQGGNNSLPSLPSIQPGAKLSDVVNTQQQPVVVNEQQPENLQAINDYISKLQTIQQPYRDALQNYINNYNDMLDRRQRAARFWQGAASLTGNPAWSKMAEQYNPLANEANRVSAIKQLQDAQAGDLNAINEVMGNMAIAKELNLPYETAFANKNLLTTLTANRKNLTDWEKALLMAELKKYGYDIGYNKAINVQGMRGDTARDVARINAAAYGMGGYQPAPGLTNTGTAPIVNNLPQRPQTQEEAVYSQIKRNR